MLNNDKDTNDRYKKQSIIPFQSINPQESAKDQAFNAPHELNGDSEKSSNFKIGGGGESKAKAQSMPRKISRQIINNNHHQQ